MFDQTQYLGGWQAIVIPPVFCLGLVLGVALFNRQAAKHIAVALASWFLVPAGAGLLAGIAAKILQR